MNSKRSSHQGTSQPSAPVNASPTAVSSMSLRRLWTLRLGVLIIIPGLFFGLTEGILRLVDFGHPTAMFLPVDKEGSAYLRTHDQFTFRFFPRAMARSVVPHYLQVPKPADTFRIVLFGESAANGDPDPAYGFGRHLEVYLNERFPSTRFEVVCTAITAINSHVIREIARDSTKLESDLWIVYMGNNEVIGPYGAGTIFGPKAPPLPFIRASLAAKRTHIGQALKILTEEGPQREADADHWEGINLFAQNLLHPGEPARSRVYQHFQSNLDAILAAGRRAGVPVLLSTVASNLKDCAPFASLHRDTLSETQRAEWTAAFERGKTLEAQGDFPDALVQYQRAAAIDGEFAELSFRIARCHEALGDLPSAYLAYTAARDTDALTVRADSTLNQIVRNTALKQASTGVHLVDVVEQLGLAATASIPGRNFFFEHVHFNPVGNVEVARIFANAVYTILPPEIRARAAAEWAEPTTSQRLLAVTLWDQHRLWLEMAQRQSQPPFINRLNNLEEIAYCQQRVDRLSAAKDHPLNRTVYEQAVAAHPDDYFLRTRFGSFLQLNGQLDEALEHFQAAADNYPDFIGPHQDLGLNLFLLGRHEEARIHFKQVLNLNPAYQKARTALSLMDKAEP